MAVERTLTEALQGRTAEAFTHINRFALKGEGGPHEWKNRSSVIQNGSGSYPYSVFLGKPDWEFRPWPAAESASNEELLRELLMLLRREGYFPLIRDASHLGFPACYILVPGMSELTRYSLPRLEERIRRKSKTECLSHFPDLSPEEARGLMEFDPLVMGEDRFSPSVLERPFRRSAAGGRQLFGYLRLALGDYQEASAHFRWVAGHAYAVSLCAVSVYAVSVCCFCFGYILFLPDMPAYKKEPGSFDMAVITSRLLIGFAPLSGPDGLGPGIIGNRLCSPLRPQRSQFRGVKGEERSPRRFPSIQALYCASEMIRLDVV